MAAEQRLVANTTSERVFRNVKDTDLLRSTYTAEATWRLIGKKFIPTNRRLVVRTDPPPKQTEGGLFLPHQMTKLNYGMPHAYFVKATVLAGNPFSAAQEGDRAVFKRLYFATLMDLPDGTSIGLVRDHQMEFLARPVSDTEAVCIGLSGK